MNNFVRINKKKWMKQLSDFTKLFFTVYSAIFRRCVRKLRMYSKKLPDLSCLEVRDNWTWEVAKKKSIRLIVTFTSYATSAFSVQSSRFLVFET